MKINPYSGYFMAIEGLDGSGSDNVCDLLEKRLRREQLPLVTVKEPSSGPVGLLIKKLLLKKEKPTSPLIWEYLFAADREWLMINHIIPALEKGKLVVADRCLWSSIAYRSPDLPIHWLLEVNKNFIIPNITFFIDVSPQVCAGRIKRGEDELQIFDEEDRLAEIADGYHWIFTKYPYWFRTIDGEKGQGEIIKEILEHLNQSVKFKKLKNNS